MKKIAILALVGAVGVSTSAMAADLGVISQPAPETFVSDTYDWSGFYAGLNLGYGWAEADVLGITDDFGNGVFGGAQVGFNYDFGGFVLGAEGDIQLSDISRTEDLGGGFSGTTSIDNFGTVRARAGVAVDRFLPYVTAGFAWANATISATTPAGSGEVDDNYAGWTVGAGAEYALTDNVSIKAEYLYLDFGGADFGTGTDIDLTSHVVRAGLNYQF